MCVCGGDSVATGGVLVPLDSECLRSHRGCMGWACQEGVPKFASLASPTKYAVFADCCAFSLMSTSLKSRQPAHPRRVAVRGKPWRRNAFGNLNHSSESHLPDWLPNCRDTLTAQATKNIVRTSRGCRGRWAIGGRAPRKRASCASHRCGRGRLLAELI
jgi:hypothetical protein